MESIIQNYYEIVKHFCAFVEESVISESNLEELMSMLLQLYDQALYLPVTEPSEIDYTLMKMSVLPLKIEVRDVYWEVYNPFDDTEEDKLVCGSIFDDINDIYWDLQEGVRAFEASDINTAVWIWKFGINNHWGMHLVDLIKALHWLRTMYAA